jgi:two-component system OmpR family sensor kinase
MLARIRRIFWIAIPLLIASAATGGWFLAKRSFAPVTAMATRAAEIGATTLHERLPVASDDELGALARVLNDLLDRLERSFDQQRRFMADASHELRTPSAVLRAEADITLSRPTRSEAEYRESMTVVQDAARRLTRIVDDIFLLARADAGHLVMHPAPVQLDDVVVDSVRAVQAIAAGRDITVELRDAVEARLDGDADLLGRVLLNLLDNAVKHAPDGSTVDVWMATGGGFAEVGVVDYGPGIPAEARERVFERFYRLDTARSRAENTITSGAGLGLAIARRIAEMHGGHVHLVESRPGRTEFRLRLPTDGARVRQGSTLSGGVA